MNERAALQAELVLASALLNETSSDQLYADAAAYESFGWHDAAAGVRHAAARVKGAEMKASIEKTG